MKVELRFKNGENNDAIGYLVKSGAPSDDGIPVKSEEEYQNWVRGSMGGSNRCREILIADSMETIHALALLRMCDQQKLESLVTKIDDNIYALGMLSLYGDYDDGMPLVLDMRQNGTPLELDGDFKNFEIDIHVAIENHPLNIPDVTPVEGCQDFAEQRHISLYGGEIDVIVECHSDDEMSI